MSKSNKQDIGKGIRALLTNIEKEQKTRSDTKVERTKFSSSDISVSQIEPNPFQPRIHFDEDSLSELAESIKTFGVIQPITVRRLSAKKYQIISGERRWRGCKLAGIKKIPAYIRDTDDQGMLEISLLENIQRSDLNPLEIAVSYQRLVDECQLTHEKLSSRLGKKRSSITNYLRLLKLPPSVQKAVKSELISLGHAKVIAGLERIENQVFLLDQVLLKSLSVRGTEELRNRISSDQKKGRSKSQRTEKHPEVRKMEDRLSETVGNPVQITRAKSGKGQIRISFSSDQELNTIIESLTD